MLCKLAVWPAAEHWMLLWRSVGMHVGLLKTTTTVACRHCESHYEAARTHVHAAATDKQLW